MKKVAIVGTQGIPASYGGFETLAENLVGKYASEDIKYTVLCSSRDMSPLRDSWSGVRLEYVHVHAHGASSVLYDIISMCKVMRGYDVILVLGCSGCIFLPVLKLLTRAKIIVNTDGIEHLRAKWGRVARAFLRLSQAAAIRFADVVVADNQGIKDYIKEHFGRDSELIAYGGDQTLRNLPQSEQQEILGKYGLEPETYAITVCRIEPENNSHLILEAFSRVDKKLVYIGNWNNSDYGRNLKKKYSKYPNLLLLDAIYSQDVLYALRKNSILFIHGNSAGGTNPSLVESMFFAKPILAYDVIYNRETTFGQASYFHTAEELAAQLADGALCQGNILGSLAKEHYTWKRIISQYEKLYREF